MRKRISASRPFCAPGVIIRKPRFWPVRGRRRGRPHEDRGESGARADRLPAQRPHRRRQQRGDHRPLEVRQIEMSHPTLHR